MVKVSDSEPKGPVFHSRSLHCICSLEQELKSALFQSTQLLNEYQFSGVKFGKGVAPSPTLVVEAKERGAFGLPPTAVDYFTYFTF